MSVIDARFFDCTWTAPQRVDFANSPTIERPDRDEIVITHMLRCKPSHGMTELPSLPQFRSTCVAHRSIMN